MSETFDLIEEYGPVTEDDTWKAFWVSALLSAVGNEEMLAAFRDQTGNQYRPPRNGIEQMIDTATGVQREFAEQFAQWFNQNVWGTDGAGRAWNPTEPQDHPVAGCRRKRGKR